MMNPLQRLQKSAQEHFPSARTNANIIDALKCGCMTVELKGQIVHIGWKMENTFTLAAGMKDGGWCYFGVKPFEKFNSYDDLWYRVQQLLELFDAGYLINHSRSNKIRAFRSAMPRNARRGRSLIAVNSELRRSHK